MDKLEYVEWMKALKDKVQDAERRERDEQVWKDAYC